jgi:hypothetical protein
MAEALPFIAAASAVMSAAGAVKSGQDQQAAMNYNASVQRQQAQIAQDQGNAAAATQDVANRRKLGDQAAAAGSSGVEMTGSPLAVMADQAMQGETAKRLAIYRGKLQSNSATDQAAIDVYSGNQAASAGITKGVSTLLTGASAFGKDFVAPSTTPNKAGG